MTTRYLAAATSGVQRFKYEENDCAVRAIANALNLPYDELHAEFKENGRQDRKGTPWHVINKMNQKYGFKPVATFGTTNLAKFLRMWVFPKGTPSCKGVELKNALPILNEGVFIVAVIGHVFAVVDGLIIDNGFNKAGHSVCAIWKLEE